MFYSYSFVQNSIITISSTVSWYDQFLENVKNFVNNIADNIGNILWVLLQIVLVVILARVAINLVSSITKHMMTSKRYHQNEKQGKRIDTLMTLTRSTMRYVIYFFAGIIILGYLGFNDIIGYLLGTAGIASVAIGFGAQSLVKDVVTGFFMMFENQFSVGEFVKIGEDEGYVEATAMRVTYLRTMKGEQIIIPNGTIGRITNYSRGNNLASVTVSTAYEANTAQIIQLLEEALTAFAKEHKDLLEGKPAVLGITAFSDSSVDIGISCKTKAMKQRQVEREIRILVKELFDENHIAFPYPHVDAQIVELDAKTQEENEPS